ncbi:MULTISPECIES: S24 family peptidase [unclassified Gilliamella]|uniref:S24 family peptidase n=1 Tax=unclassified Gilliamella TaxID=2685620 RepID=UPI00226AE08A|nr:MULTISPECIES: S24 family peptidase [unclassified Gilliamella]MCX8582501.1 helix-turn-helix domain-containing protein [Gilliamella sp. B3372]MCX8594416.1 helix-turn-helix domain-containing protein [Gilliamella sp. B3367]
MIDNVIRNLKYLMSEKGILNVTELARLTKIHQPTLHRLLAGDVKDPKYINLKQLADYFGVVVSDLVEKDLSSIPTNHKIHFNSVPIVGNAQLGDGGFWTGMEYPVGTGDGFIYWPTTDKDAYALKCKGDSMMPRIKNGEYVVVEPNHRYIPGDEVLVVTADSKVMVKTYLYTRGGVATFISINEEHPPIKINESDIDRIHYVAGIAKESLRFD